jgi:cytochrome c-type biogenesis protein CcmH/NrfF
VARTEKLPPGPYYEPVTSWREISLWLLGIVVIVVGATLALIYLS